VLTVTEIYRAILGESLDAGRVCVIVRLTGCHRRCVYCDSAFAFQGGRRLSVDEACAAALADGSGTVLVTGGEPLLQREVVPLLARLVAAGRRVVLETSGTRGAAVALAEVPAGVRRVVDVKTPGSGLAADPADVIDWEGLQALGPGDELKFVCVDRADYVWARDLIREGRRLPAGPCRTFSPGHGLLPARELAAWLLADGLEARLQVQLHKLLWPDRERGT
jgi:7-carboxy-7-deazaguanine synthase